MKPRRIRNPELVKEYRKDFCQLCGRDTILDNHHIFPKSIGGPDAKWNLITLCNDGRYSCHELAQTYKIPRIKLLLYKIEQLKHEEPPEVEVYEAELQAMLDFCFPRLKEEEYHALLVKAGKEPEIAR